MSPRLAFALETAVAAGRLTLAEFGSATAELKSDGTPVTRSDQAAERLIRERIAAAYPNEGILGEEEGEAGSAEKRWVIDPIDGTKSFASGVPLYATLLAYEKGEEPQIGVAYFPALGDLYYAEAGAGAYRNGVPLRVPEQTDLRKSIVCFGGLAKLRDRSVLNHLVLLSERCLGLRTWCDAYGHMMVASGRAGAMIDPSVSRWDISAVSLIVREAGAHFTDLEGNSGLGGSALSGAPGVHQSVLEALRCV